MIIQYDDVPEYGKIFCNYLKSYVTKENTNKTEYHPYSELVVIRQGNIIYTARRQTKRLSGKCVIYNRADTIHNQFVQYDHIYERYRVKFYAKDILSSSEDGWLLSDVLKTSFVKEMCDEDFDLIYALSKSIFEANRSEALSELEKARMFIELKLAILKTYTAPSRDTQHEENYIIDVIKYIYEHLGENLKIEEIATLFFVSKSKLTYDFRAYCNMSIHEYITLERIEKAKDLIENGYMISAVAEMCGFSSSSYFIKVFSSITGMTPLKYQFSHAKGRN